MLSISELLNDNSFLNQNMNVAVEIAKQSIKTDVPIGAVIYDVESQKIIAKSGNTREQSNDPTCHAEISVIREASKHIGDWRLNNMILFSTLEPCIMCAGALVQCRIGALVYGASDPQYGSAGSIYNPLSDPRLNHNTKIIRGVLSDECQEIIDNFFKERRTKK
ncbi:MAG: nucleoside deaminase [Acidimicrobiia bacterium]